MFMIGQKKIVMYEKEKDVESFFLSAFDLPPADADQFRFTTPSGSINWSTVVGVDLVKVVKENNYVSLKENISNIINYDLDSTAASNILDTRFLKLFRLAQLTIEYLLYVQKCLRNLIDLYENENIARQETEKLSKNHKEFVSDLNDLRSISNKYSYNSKVPHIVFFENEVKNIFRCSFCGKVFLDGYYLTAHHQRRHADLKCPMIQEISGLTSNACINLSGNTSDVVQRGTDKIWKELEHLRERMNECESCNTLKKMRTKEETKKRETAAELNEKQAEVIEEYIADDNAKENKSDEKRMKKSEIGNGEADVKYQCVLEESTVIREDGRLEAQERVWRGRLKAVADESAQEIASLRKIITSYQEKVRVLEEENKEKIEKLTFQLNDQAARKFETNAVETVDPEAIVPAPSPKKQLSPSSSLDSFDTSAPACSIHADNEDQVDLNSTFPCVAEERNETSDSEMDSSDVSTSTNMQRVPKDQGEGEGAITMKVFEQKLKYFDVNPKAKKMPEKIFKEKMEAIHKLRKNMAKNIEGYHQIKSNIEQKAHAKVSQRLLRHNSEHSRIPSEFLASSSSCSSEQTNGIISTEEKRKAIEMHDHLSSPSQKDVSVPSTSRSFSSNASHPLKPKPSLIKSVATVETSKPWTSTPESRGYSGLNTITSYVHHEVQKKSKFSDSSAFQTVCSKGFHGSSPGGGGILRGSFSHPNRCEGDKRVSSVPLLGNVGTKSVSFSLAHNLIPGKAL